jgi:O-antigen/teichoic acid export membrane protein
MGIVFRQSVKSTIAISIGALLGALTMYLSTHFIPKQEYGFRGNLTNQAVVAGQILLLGLHNMLAVYIHRYPDGDKRKTALISISLILPAIIILLASIFYMIFREHIVGMFQPQDIPYIKRYFMWLPVYVLLFAYQVLLETFLISQLKIAKAIFIREVVLRLINIGLIVLFGFGYISFDHLIYGTVLAYLIPIVSLAIIANGTGLFNFSLHWNVFAQKEKRDIVHFTWYHSLLSISINLLGMLDALMLASLSTQGLSSVAVYIVAIFIISFLQIPYKAMVNSTFPILAQAFSNNDTVKVNDIFRRSSMNIFIASGGMFLIIACNLDNAIAILPKGYEAVAPVVLILSLGRMVDMATGITDQVFSLSKYYKYNFYISLLLILFLIGFNWWLIPVYDVVGAAWASTGALILYNVTKLLIVYSKMRLQPFSMKSIYVVTSILATLIVGYCLPEIDNPFADATYRSVIIVIAYTLLLIAFKPSEDLNSYLTSIKKNRRLF